ncbi:MAG: hypothetical protein IKT27_06325 [Clostridia bacterium]|nr:hypothetical protein [Clostridia bacterium]
MRSATMTSYATTTVYARSAEWTYTTNSITGLTHSPNARWTNELSVCGVHRLYARVYVRPRVGPQAYAGPGAADQEIQATLPGLR